MLAVNYTINSGRRRCMVKLKKTKSVSWNGYGFGNSSAEWVVDGHEHLKVLQLNDWVAIDTNTGKRVARGYSKKMLLQILQEKIN
jgi:polygalacturonase